MKSNVRQVVLCDQVRKQDLGRGQSRDVRERVVIQFAQYDACWEDGGELFLRAGQNHPTATQRGVIHGFRGKQAAAIKAALNPEDVGTAPPPKPGATQ